MIDYRVYLVTDDPSRYCGDWLEKVRAAVEGGVTCVQYRDTENSQEIQYRRILALQDALTSCPVPIIVNNDAELARAVKADGIHVGQGDLPPEAVRTIVGAACEIGLSITNVGQMRAFREQRFGRGCVDCLGIGPVFDARKTKRDAADAMGPEGLRTIVDSLPEMPNCAIGGINLENAARVVAAGAKGLAVVSAFSMADDPYGVAKKFLEVYEKSVNRRFVRAV